MNAVVKGSVILAVAVSLVSIVVLAAGLHTNPVAGSVIPIVAFIAFNVAAVIWVLKQTATENGYGKQLLNGLLLGLIAGALIFVLSWTTMTFIFPDAIAESKDVWIDVVESSGLPEAQMEQQIAKIEESTAVSQAVQGTVGTIVTSLIIAGITAIFLRKK